MKSIKLEVDAKVKGQKDIDGLNESLEQTQEEQEGISKGFKKVGESGEKAKSGLGKVAKGFKGIGLAIKAAGFGLILATMNMFFEVVKQNQPVMDVLTTAFETVSIVFNEVTQAVIDAYKSVSDLTGGFDATKRIVGNLIKISLTPLKLTFYAIKLAVQEAQLIWEKSMFGDKDQTTIDELNKSIQETKDNIKGVAKGVIDAGAAIVDDFAEAVQEVGSVVKASIEGISEISVSAAYESAKANIALSKSALIATAEQEKLMKLYMREAEIQRQIRDNVNVSLKERIEANDELNKILDKQEETMIAQADIILANAEAQFKKNGNDENYVALLDAQRNKLDVLEDLEGKRSEQKVNDIGLTNELLALTQSQIDADTALALRKRKFAAEQETDTLKQIDLKRAILEEEKIIEMERLQNIIDSYAEGTQAKIDAEIAFNEKMQELKEEGILLEGEYAKETVKIKKEEAGAKEDIQKISAQNTIGLLGGMFGMLADLSEADFERQKKFKIAESVMSTVQGGISAFMGGVATIPGPFGVALGAVLAGITLATGFANVQKIRSSTPNSSGSGGGSFSGGASRTGEGSIPTITAPTAGQVTPSTAGEQRINDSISDNNTTPIKTYAVSSDMTSQQELDRRIESKAAI